MAFTGNATFKAKADSYV